MTARPRLLLAMEQCVVSEPGIQMCRVHPGVGGDEQQIHLLPGRFLRQRGVVAEGVGVGAVDDIDALLSEADAVVHHGTAGVGIAAVGGQHGGMADAALSQQSAPLVVDCRGVGGHHAVGHKVALMPAEVFHRPMAAGGIGHDSLLAAGADIRHPQPCRRHHQASQQGGHHPPPAVAKP